VTGAPVTVSTLSAAVLALLATGCGAPTAQVLQPPDSPFAFEVPADFTDLGAGSGDEAGRLYSLEGSTVDELGSDPVLLFTTGSNGADASFQSLRTLATGGQYDPLDPDLDEAVTGGRRVLDYSEITEADVWGIRMLTVAGRTVSDFQALVERRSDRVVLTEVACTQSCYLENVDLIDRLQTSWSLE